MMTAFHDRNLLFGIMAMQADLITQQQFLEICSLWSTRKESSLGELLVEKKWLTINDQADLEKLLDRKLQNPLGNAPVPTPLLTLAQEPTDPLPAEVNGSATLSRVDPGSAPTIDRPVTEDGLATTDFETRASGDRYHLIRMHATGGIGRVWLAKDVALGREVALKELRSDRHSSAGIEERFVLEARITGQLEHPGIIPIYELGTHPDGRPFYTMRFIKGRTFRDAIQIYHQKRERGDPHALELQQLLTAFVSICNAVGYAHSRGIVHRDLKPANIVLGDFGEVMVLDWGLAKVLGDDSVQEGSFSLSSVVSDSSGSRTVDGQVLGTPAYMAPEQATGEIQRIDAHTDVYGLGAILYELLTNQPPFRGNTMEELLRRVTHLQPERPRDQVKGIARPLEAICLKCLAKKSEDRYADAKLLATEMQQFLADEPIQAWREPRWDRVRRWGRRHRGLVASGIITLLIAVPVLITGILLLNRSEQQERAARQLAQASYTRTLRSANAMAEELARGVRPLLGTERKTVLSIVVRANQIYEDLLSDPNPSREVLESQAKTLVMFSDLYREMGQSVPARTTAERSLAIFEGLLQDDPQNAKLLLERSRARHRKAWVLLDQGYDRESVQEFQICIDELNTAGSNTDPLERARLLSSAHTFIGNQLLEMGDWNNADQAYRRGFEIREQAVKQFPDDLDLKMSLSLSGEKWGSYLKEKLKHIDGRPMIERACLLAEEVVAKDPWNTERNLNLVRIYSTLSNAAETRDRRRECVEKAQAIIDRFAARDPEHYVWQRAKLRHQWLQKNLDSKRNLSDPEAREKDRRSEIALNEELLKILETAWKLDPENYLTRTDLVNLGNRIAEGLVDLYAIKPDPALLPQIRTVLEEGAKHLEPLQKRSPESTNLQVMFHINRRWMHRLLILEQKLPEAILIRIESFQQENREERTLRARVQMPTEQEAEFSRTCRRVLVDLMAVNLDPHWPVLLREPQVIAAFVGLARDLDPIPDWLSEDNRKNFLAVRMFIAEKLEAIQTAGNLSSEGVAALKRLRQK
jgi:serine/threonine protein kinase